MTILAQGDRSSRVDLQACKLCINESANARGEAVCVLGALPLPRSLTRCARSFGCGERYQLTQRR
ncbi:SocE [Bacillus cereus W]|nr:SocE [Bacillus cereus W]EDX54397.1 SocE [Bacillus cereus W]EDX54398.1 SocE [Bacillus cereus W]EDX54400.1 SocE [Bacillus cereus W]EDX54403.1 SocE [Bacillus cereus W]